LLDRARGVLVERRVDGPEYSVEIMGGEAVGLTRKHLGSPPYFVEVGHDHPADVPAEVTEELTATAVRAVRAVGLTTGPAHVELRLPPEEPPVVIEINPRLAGGLIPRLVAHATGRDLVAETVAHAARLPVGTVARRTGFAAVRFVVPGRDGVVAAVRGVADAAARPGVVEAGCSVAPGTRIVVEHSFRDRRGHVIGAGPTAGDAVAAAERGLADIVITYTPPPRDEEGAGRARRRIAQ
ncbi:ATP-grasp domain-containing protein, partial [Amycolatopsis sp. NPDC049252]|uniref:ATP-grasp domain-containing protein n=1 Tax=Amycolatopsis sp. NPDC049252 TaxID=3363933 RepID=UPI00372169D5